MISTPITSRGDILPRVQLDSSDAVISGTVITTYTSRLEMNDITSSLGTFELVDRDAYACSKSAYDWIPPHWVPNPAPADYDIVTAPWIRPEQVALSLVGESPVSSMALREGRSDVGQG